MHTFGEFLYTLRKEKGMTQAELAQALNVTNKAVSKWETGEAMPETAQLLPIAQIFGVTVDELLKGERREDADGNGYENEDIGETIHDEIKNHLFTRGKDDEDAQKSLAEKICGAVCAAIMLIGITVYLFLGALKELWTPYWLIIPLCALSCGIIGIISDMCNPAKRRKREERGENAYAGGICGIAVLASVAAYLLSAALTGLWHPLWIIVAAGVFVCFIVGAVGDIFTHKK